MKKVSLNTIASMLGVSAVTVHKALKNQQGVSEALRAKVVTLADELGYKPRVEKQNYEFVFLIHKTFILSPNEQFYSEIYHCLNVECMLANSKLNLIVVDDVKATISSIKTVVNDKHIDGVFISGEIGNDILDYVKDLKLPVTCIDLYSSDYPFDYIYVDNYYASHLLTKYLIKRGHANIGFIGNIRFSSAIADRYFGYRRALNKYKIPFDSAYHINRNIESEDFSLPKEMPSAFICHCDRAALFLYERLRQLNLSIPYDVSVISFDNTDLCEHLSPKLTSFGIEKSNYASQALKTMLARITNQKVVYNYTKLNLDLYERESVKDIKVSLKD